LDVKLMVVFRDTDDLIITDNLSEVFTTPSYCIDTTAELDSFVYLLI
jgi:hypothetical protein